VPVGGGGVVGRLDLGPDGFGRASTYILVTPLHLDVPDDAHGGARGSVLQHEEAWGADPGHGGGGSSFVGDGWLGWLWRHTTSSAGGESGGMAADENRG
jgi:hypothetical protein